MFSFNFFFKFVIWLTLLCVHSEHIFFVQEITQFLQFVKNIYTELPNHLNKIFEPRGTIKVGLKINSPILPS